MVCPLLPESDPIARLLIPTSIYFEVFRLRRLRCSGRPYSCMNFWRSSHPSLLPRHDLDLGRQTIAPFDTKSFPIIPPFRYTRKAKSACLTSAFGAVKVTLCAINRLLMLLSQLNSFLYGRFSAYAQVGADALLCVCPIYSYYARRSSIRL